MDAYITRAQGQLSHGELAKWNSPRYVLAQELVERTIDVNEIRKQLLNVFLPAHEAARVALTNVFFNLARNPRAYEKLPAEILAVGDDEVNWTFESLKYLQYGNQ